MKVLNFEIIVDVTGLDNEHLSLEESSEPVITSTDVSLEKSKKAKALK